MTWRDTTLHDIDIASHEKYIHEWHHADVSVAHTHTHTHTPLPFSFSFHLLQVLRVLWLPELHHYTTRNKKFDTRQHTHQHTRDNAHHMRREKEQRRHATNGGKCTHTELASREWCNNGECNLLFSSYDFFLYIWTNIAVHIMRHMCTSLPFS